MTEAFVKDHAETSNQPIRCQPTGINYIWSLNRFGLLN